MRAALGRLYRDGQAIEVNVLTDRIMLTVMRNCDAGVTHVTIAPNGKCYICPAFYHDDERSFIGAFDGKNGIPVKHVAGVDLPAAPLCTRCDAFHRKRCVYLNRKTTLELNVPSEEQCAVAHIEREASRQLLIDLRSIEPFRGMPASPNSTTAIRWSSSTPRRGRFGQRRPIQPQTRCCEDASCRNRIKRKET